MENAKNPLSLSKTSDFEHGFLREDSVMQIVQERKLTKNSTAFEQSLEEAKESLYMPKD